jgi:hypothetical protein
MGVSEMGISNGIGNVGLEAYLRRRQGKLGDEVKCEVEFKVELFKYHLRASRRALSISPPRQFHKLSLKAQLGFHQDPMTCTPWATWRKSRRLTFSTEITLVYYTKLWPTLSGCWNCQLGRIPNPITNFDQFIVGDG